MQSTLKLPVVWLLYLLAALWPFDGMVGLAARLLDKADVSVGFQDGPLDLIE
jgi:hypothetical protein